MGEEYRLWNLSQTYQLVKKTENLDDYSWQKASNDIKSEIISLKGLLLST